MACKLLVHEVVLCVLRTIMPEFTQVFARLFKSMDRKPPAPVTPPPQKGESANNHSESIKFGDRLPAEYTKPLEVLKQVAPEGFQHQAELLAYIFYSLDTNRKLLDQDGNSLEALAEAVRQEVANMPSIKFVYFMSEKTNFGLKTPEQALPQWVQRSQISDTELPRPEQAVKFYDSWSKKHGEPEERTNGTYFSYDPKICPEPGDSQVDTFKCYLEEDSPESDLESAFGQLASSRLHPHQSKLFEGDRIVLYWQNFPSADITAEIKNIFSKNNVKIRGFGQDSIEVDIDRDHAWKFQTRSSNDQARGEAGGSSDFGKYDYSPEKFFSLYIQQMFRHCRNPLNQYRMSFVPVLQTRNAIADTKGLEAELEKIRQRGIDVKYFADRLPLLYSD